MAGTASYPAHWEADVVLSDGATAHLRPIVPDDARRLLDFYERVSDESKYYRFFAAYPRLSRYDVQRFTDVDHRDRVGLILLVGDNMIAVGRYERLPDEEASGPGGEAEVSFLVEDSHQGRGVGSVLLEHLAQAARERGLARFVAYVLPGNKKMIGVFADAGYTVDNRFEDGVVRVEFQIVPTATSMAVMAAREHRAESRSIQRLLTPRSVVVIGAGQRLDETGRRVLRALERGGFAGPVYSSVRDVPGEIDLAVLTGPAESAQQAVLDCADKAARGLVVMSAGFAETGDPAGLGRQSELVRLARARGMRVVGPNCLGVVNTDPSCSLNATAVEVMPPPGRVGVFAQSSSLAEAVLRESAARGLGVSTFVAAGNRADVSGNDLLQYWRDDPATDVVALCLESLGNPRKFARLSRRVAEVKPVVAVKSGRLARLAPLGHVVRPIQAPVEALDAMFGQSGVILVDTIAELLDTAQLLVGQPLPTTSTVAIAGDAAAGLLAADAAIGAGLRLHGQPAATSAAELGQTLTTLAGAEDVGAVLAVLAPADQAPDLPADPAKPVMTSFLGGRSPSGAAALAPEAAARMLGRAAAYARWRRTEQGHVPTLDDIDEAAASRLADEFLDGQPEAELTASQLRELLGAYGVNLLPMIPAPTVDAAVAAARDLGGSVVLKATAPRLRHRPDLAGVWRDIDTEAEMRDAWQTLAGNVGDPASARFVVQPMASGGVPVAIGAAEDAVLGPVVSFAVGGAAAALLGDRSHRIPPLTDRDCAEMVREVKAAPLLMGHRGGIMADLPAVEDLLHRVSRLVADIPAVRQVDLDSILVAESGLAAVNGAGQVAVPFSRSDWYTRRLA